MYREVDLRATIRAGGNQCFGGRHKHVLFVTASTSVYSVALNRRGC
jgi:hypothetical protein